MTLTNAKLRRLAEIVANDYGITVEAMMANNRKQPGAEARQVLAFLGDQMFGLGSAEIGRQYGKDHSTVIQAWQAVLKRVKTDADFEERLDRIRERYEAIETGETDRSGTTAQAAELASVCVSEAEKALNEMRIAFAKLSIITKELADGIDRAMKNLKELELEQAKQAPP